jgi:hypothetical protein
VAESPKSPVGTVFGVLLIAALASVFAAQTAHAQPAYVWGDASTVAVTDNGFKGYWRYCLSIGWDVSQYPDGPHGASHLSIILGLEECLADCNGQCFIFPDTVGVSDGVGGCTVYYYAEFDLKGDPTIPPDIPTLKFEPYPGTCEPGVTGTATVCFYSLIPPELGESSPGSIWIKFGRYTEEGPITGKLPSCKGTTTIDSSTWSSIKRLFR